jgi:hypothetical protein
MQTAWHLEPRHDRPIDIDRTPQDIFCDSFAQCGLTRAGGQREGGRIAVRSADFLKTAADFS